MMALPAQWRSLGFRARLMLALLVLAAAPGSVRAQMRDSVPSTRYFTGFNVFYEGDYRDAVNLYSDELRGGIKSAQSRWIDSICYHTMTGECYYQMGQLSQALDQYTRALQLYAAFSDWMIRVQFPPGIQQAGLNARPMVPWGASKRIAKVGQFSETFLMSQGQVNNNAVIQNGGVVQQAQMFPVRVSEIVRATCLAMRRRRELLGPLCKHDPVTTKVQFAIARRAGLPNHWSQAWIEVQLGLAHAAMGNVPQAASMLERAILAGGEYDHPLTSTALLELGRLALEAGDYNTAARLFEETTYAAVAFTDLGVLEEAFRLGQMTHVISGAKGPYPLLAPAVQWAKQRGYRQLYASLATLLAENLAVLGDTQSASGMIAEARNAIGRRSMGDGVQGARTNYVNALVMFQSGNLAAGEQLLKTVWTYQQSGSFWLFHIGLVDKACVSRTINADRIILQLYEAVLRDPTPADWASSPMESITVLTTPHPLPYEHWFETAAQRTQDRELAVEVADRARRNRFFSTLPMGGRLLALRWVLEGPDELLDKQPLLQRQDLLSKYPQYDKLSQRAKQLQADLAAIPPVPENDDQKRKQAVAFNELAGIGTAQELILREMAVRREPADMIFPPLRRVHDLQRSMPEGQVLLTFFNTSRATYGFLFSRDKYAMWPVASAMQIRKHLQLLLRDLGNFEQNHQLGQNELTTTDWKKNAIKLRDLLLEKSKIDLGAKIDELVIVPDGILWYLPWEALPVGDDDAPLLSHTKIRYAPTIGLSTPYSARPLSMHNVGVVVGKLYPQDKPEVGQAAYEAFHRAIPTAVALPDVPTAPSSLYRRLFDQLVVLDDIEPSANGPYDWSPAQLDRGKSGGQLADWLSLPWTSSPDELILPGFHSSAENGLKTKKGIGDGSDLFLPVCGLMSTGTRSLLISRWRTGGQTSCDLVREFAQELPHTSPADSWQRSVMLAQGNSVDPDVEPRVKRLSVTGDPPKAEHPFFWSGYMLVDMGPPSQKIEPVPAAAPPAALNFQQKQQAAGKGAAKAPEDVVPEEVIDEAPAEDNTRPQKPLKKHGAKPKN
jgi:tetratricopeptide (TPR) repeat protein